MFGSRIILVTFLGLTLYNIKEVDAVVGPILIGALTPGAAVGGLVTGIIGVILGGVSVALALGKIEVGGDEEEDMMMMMKDSMEGEMGTMMYGTGNRGGGTNYYGGYQRRYKRDLNHKIQQKAKLEKLQMEKFLDKVYQKDTSQCLEKMMCTVSSKLSRGEQLSPDEKDILKIVELNKNHGYLFKKLVVAQKVGAMGGECDFLFNSCPFHTSQMIQLIEATAKSFQNHFHKL